MVWIYLPLAILNLGLGLANAKLAREGSGFPLWSAGCSGISFFCSALCFVWAIQELCK